VTPDTSHFEMLLLNNGESRNISSMPVTLDTSHFEISPSHSSLDPYLAIALPAKRTWPLLGYCSACESHLDIGLLLLHQLRELDYYLVIVTPAKHLVMS
jgi:hypothetical protein